MEIHKRLIVTLVSHVRLLDDELDELNHELLKEEKNLREIEDNIKCLNLSKNRVTNHANQTHRLIGDVKATYIGEIEEPEILRLFKELADKELGE
jgi:septal ring factor EnvC (AmiA/AmiB activator)